MRGIILLLAACISPLALTAESCPWMNSATAGGAFGGPVTTATVKRAGEDATCDFLRQQGSQTQELRIETETLRSPAKDFKAHATHCGSDAVALKAIGNEAFACSDEADRNHVTEQVIGRVRDHAFLVRLTSSDRSVPRSALRETARKLAEQVAGILF